MARILITSALPYINGVKHLGNLVGSQLPAREREAMRISNEPSDWRTISWLVKP